MMSQLPFELPKSLASYADHFQQEPKKAIERLQNQVQKRGPDAVGYFLLAWLHHIQGNHEEAVSHALKAKNCAPGSPFFEKLHYYLIHPQTFDAWKPDPSSVNLTRSGSKIKDTGPVLDLDALIERLADAESEKIQISADKPDQKDSGITPGDSETEDIVSDTLANIHETQGKTEAAIRTYERLKKLNKEKKDFYQEKIDELKKKQEEGEEDE